MTTKTQRLVPILVYEDIAAAHEFLVGIFGFNEGVLNRDADGRPTHAEVSIGEQTIWLHRVSPDFGLVSPRTHGASTGMIAVMVDDIEDHYARVQQADVVVEFPPTDQPYGVREYGVRGPEGELWSFMASNERA